MRTFEEIVRDIQHATDINDAEALRALVPEMEALGIAARQTGDYPLALEYYHRALALYEELGDLAGVSTVTVNIGVAHFRTGEYESALKHYQHALVLYDEMGSRLGSAKAIGNIGGVYFATGNYPLALEHYHRALALCEELGDRARMAGVNSNIGNVYGSNGSNPSALEHYHRALALYEELGNHVGVAIVIGNIGNVYNNTGNYPLALEHFHRALTLNEGQGDSAGVASVTCNIGIVHTNTGNYPLALEHYHRALTLYEERGDRAGVARVACNIGKVYGDTGDYVSALEHYHRALALDEELGSLASAAGVTGNVIEVLLKLDRLDEAGTLLERQANIRMENPLVRSEHEAHSATLAERRDDLDAAQRHLLEALSISTEAGLRANCAEYHEKLRDLAQKRNDFGGYIEHNKEYQRITEEIRGKEATQRLSMMEAERKMEGERRERDKERALLYGALPKSIADRMIRGEKITGDHFEHAAVLFIDVAAFTTHTAAMHPGDVVLLLEDLFSRMDSICDHHGVVKVKTIGDSYMCFRGDADAHTNALCMMHVALDVMSQSFTWPDGSPLVVRMGAHIGPATAGVIGTQRLQYDVWGDTVNVASRMESHGEPGRVHVSEAFAFALSQGRLRQGQPGQGQPSQSNDIVIPSEARNEEPGTWHLALRGETELKGKGTMTTYWLEHAP